MDPQIILMLVSTACLLGGLYFLFHNLNKKYRQSLLEDEMKKKSG